MLLQNVHSNIRLLKRKLYNSAHVQATVESVIIDGSFARGDFLDTCSDIDITITSSSKAEKYTRTVMLALIQDVEKELPVRDKNCKPLRYDIQWQSLDTVRETGKRKFEEWSIENIPSGYPKLWLYAFDSIANHMVLFGKDVTEYYTEIEPKEFVPIRLQRITDAVCDIKGEPTEYECAYGGVTQIKNAWETVRALCLKAGLASIKKQDIYDCSQNIFSNTEHLKIITKLWKYFHDSSGVNMDIFRNELYHFTIDLLNL